MNFSKENPPTNILPNGLAEADIDKAITKSGYPLQLIIGEKLRKRFHCQDEWSYIDSDSHEIRTMDILASARLYTFDNDNQPRVRPELNLLIECKQSDLPYIFFLTPDKIFTNDFPLVAGLFSKNLKVVSDYDPSSWHFSVIHALQLQEQEFLNGDVPTCFTFSKCVRKGPDVILSGTDGYNNLVLPLLKALKHFDASEVPPKTAHYFDAHLCLAIGVLDAPMIGVTVTETGHISKLLPCVRVYRHDSIEHKDWSQRSKLSAIDLVHKDYFDQYMEEKVIPFAKRYSELVLKHGTVLAEGKAFVKGMGDNSWTDIEPRLTEYSLLKKRIMPKL
ncbi:hypothetical protein [Mucilaginibacter kameinonensis]|uniref:hypothetical protein n=1 Tax=Mucilaginibacter kameinonensis TaxID=452286 RepID=UPI000EF75A89|nr:hypothetical protein [Mucilaginibacter kameinonensis]